MTKTALAEKPAARVKAREPVTNTEPVRENKREAVREIPPGAITFQHPETGEVFVRMPSSSSSGSALDFPVELFPEGFTYQWIRESTYGEPDRPNLLARGRQGWRPVPAERHPEYPVAIDGLRLYEAPTQFVEAAQREERLRARQQGQTRKPDVRLPNGFDASQKLSFAKKGAPERMPSAYKPQLTRSVDMDE